MLIKTEVEITPRRIADLMVTAIEGGIGYWCKSVKLLHHDTKLEKPWYDDETLYVDGANINIEVIEGEPSSNENVEGSWIINLASMEKAFMLMQEFGKPKGFHFRNFIQENEDAETADVWFQLAVFGEVVYG